jgi:hypothetical protein
MPRARWESSEGLFGYALVAGDPANVDVVGLKGEGPFEHVLSGLCNLSVCPDFRGVSPPLSRRGWNSMGGGCGTVVAMGHTEMVEMVLLRCCCGVGCQRQHTTTVGSVSRVERSARFFNG